MSEAAIGDLWIRTTSVPELREGDLQVWRLNLGGPKGRRLLAHAFDALTAEERQRAAKMRTGAGPEEFIAGRGSLRRLLSAALDCDPQDIGIVIGPHRKPALRLVRGLRAPQFNVSHSHGMVLIALSRAGSVGVDVEYMDSTVEAINVARGAFHADDLRRIESARTQEEKLFAFYACWTRREAVAKADGRGLTLPASGFSTGTYTDGERRVDVGVDDTTHSAGHYGSRFFVRNVSVSPTHLGGVAVARSHTLPMLLDLPDFLIEGSNPRSRMSSTSFASYAGGANNKLKISLSGAKTNLSGN